MTSSALQRVATTSVTAAVFVGLFSGAAAAAPPTTRVVEVAFPVVCDGVSDPLLAENHVKITTWPERDGVVRVWQDARGTITNQVTGTVVRARANRLYKDDLEADRTKFTGVELVFWARGHGVLFYRSGTQVTGLTDPSEVFVQHGWWPDAGPDQLPPSVCAALGS